MSPILVNRLSNDESGMFLWRFVFDEAAFTLRLVSYEEFTRTDETAPWASVGEWKRYNLTESPMLPKPETPDWVQEHATKQLINALKFEV